MAVGKKIRVYDLAKEVKQDTKRIMEELRREGADISVPSNSVSAELAEKIRKKYVTKTEVAPKRTIKVIKASKKPDEPAEETTTAEPIEQPTADEPAIHVSETPKEPKVKVAEPAGSVESADPEVKKSVRKVLVKKTPEPVEVDG